MAFPVMLFSLAWLVEIVPANYMALNEIPASHLSKAISREAVVGNHVTLSASGGSRSAKVWIHVAEASKREAVSTIVIEGVCVDKRILWTTLQTVEKSVAKRIVLNWPIPPCASAQIYPCLVAVDEIPDEHRCPYRCRAFVHIP
jgi:hypothetical protein